MTTKFGKDDKTMKKKNDSAIRERILAIEIKDFEPPSDEKELMPFAAYCKSCGLEYEKRVDWHVELDTRQEIPQIKDGAFQNIEHDFKLLDKSQRNGVKYVFRIMRGHVIFNFLSREYLEQDNLQSVFDHFIPLWKAFIDHFKISGGNAFSLCYVAELNENTLYRDPSLFKKDWLEVKEILSFCKGVKAYPFATEYQHPLFCRQQWKTQHSDLGNVVLKCDIKSIESKDMISLIVYMEVKLEQFSKLEQLDKKTNFWFAFQY